MRSPSDSQRSLAEVDDTVLIVIDIQDHFLAKYDRAKSARVVANVAWLLKVAQALDVPVVAMAEDIATLGTLTAPVLDALPPGTGVHDKDSYGLAGNPAILTAVAATGRRSAVCVGMETDVCVAQSVLGLLAEGFRVLVPHDAVASMEADETTGLERMRGAGAAITSVKALYYEWLRSVSRTVSLANRVPELEALRPATLVL